MLGGFGDDQCHVADAARRRAGVRVRDYDAEIAFGRKARGVPPPAWPGLLDWLRRAHADPARGGGSGPALGRRGKGRPPRTFWMFDPDTGEWRLL